MPNFELIPESSGPLLGRRFWDKFLLNSVSDRNFALRRWRLAAALVVCGAWLAAESAAAEPRQAPAVDRASYERETRPGRAEAVHFTQRGPQVGDQTEQTVAVALRLDTMVRQGSELVEQAKTTIRREQRRVVTATEVESGRTVAALVRYVEATKQVATGQTAADLQAGPTTPQPVAGKAYRCRREGDELRITDAQGNIPPLDQFEIIALNMESLGRPNPLADFLAGRTVAVGATIELPNELAEKLLGLGDTLGKVTQFRLTLDKIEPVDSAECAVFHASIDAASNDSSQLRLQLEGPLVIQAATCRAVQASLTGPIGMSETRGSLTAAYQMTGAGKMTVEIASTYRDVAR